jgi:hypothetical protein
MSKNVVILNQNSSHIFSDPLNLIHLWLSFGPESYYRETVVEVSQGIERFVIIPVYCRLRANMNLGLLLAPRPCRVSFLRNF